MYIRKEKKDGVEREIRVVNKNNSGQSFIEISNSNYNGKRAIHQFTMFELSKEDKKEIIKLLKK